MFYVFFIYSIPLQIIHSPVSLECNSSICLSQKLECSVIWNSDYSYWISKNSSRRTTQRHKQYNTLYIYWKIWNQIDQPNFWLKSKPIEFICGDFSNIELPYFLFHISARWRLNGIINRIETLKKKKWKRMEPILATISKQFFYNYAVCFVQFNMSFNIKMVITVWNSLQPIFLLEIKRTIENTNHT